jgi:hypothetical protein
MVFHRLHRPAFSTACQPWFGTGFQRCAISRVASYYVRTKPDLYQPIQVLMVVTVHPASGWRNRLFSNCQLRLKWAQNHKVRFYRDPDTNDYTHPMVYVE